MLPGNTGEFIIPNPDTVKEKDKQLMQGLTNFVCALCDYPLLPSWKYCPDCGGQVLWAGNISEGDHGAAGS